MACTSKSQNRISTSPMLSKLSWNVRRAPGSPTISSTDDAQLDTSFLAHNHILQSTGNPYPDQHTQPTDCKHRKSKCLNHARQRKCLCAKEENFGLATPRQELYKKYLGAVQSSLKAVDVHTTKSGYTGLNHKIEEQSIIGLEELIGLGSAWKFKLQKWNGR